MPLTTSKIIDMKIIVILILISTAFSIEARSQDYADAYATKIANRMKDSLILTEGQKGQIYTISKNLGDQKKAVWIQYAGVDSLIHQNLQQIENTRDELYRPVLGGEKFILYRQKKKYLLNNN